MITDRRKKATRLHPPQNTISLWVPQGLHDRLNEYCNANCINRSAYVREAIEAHMGRQLAQKAPIPLVNLDWK